MDKPLDGLLRFWEGGGYRLMLQAIVKRGRVIGERVPLPAVSEGCALIKVMYSCISAGTEVSTIRSSEKSMIRKALGDPEYLKRAFHMLRSEGVAGTMEKIKRQLDAGSAIGYSLSGIVIGTGENLKGFAIGDRVACAGTGMANHAEYVDVPKNLIVRIPVGLGFQEASTVALGAIAMQGIRRASLEMGEYVVVYGLGNIGQLVLQMAKNAGCRVIAIDLDERRLKISKENGADLVLNPLDTDSVKEVTHFTDGIGADKVLFAAATSSSQPLRQAFQMTRGRGKVVLVGASGMELKREDLYPKEIDLLISASYGPGRYDENYEKNGLDYPYSYVRWTENRNMREYVKELGEGKIDLSNLIEKVYPIDQVAEAYEELQTPNRPLMTLLEYDQTHPGNLCDLYQRESKLVTFSHATKQEGIINVGVIGAGGFAGQVHLPNLLKLRDKYRIYAVMNKTPHKAKAIAAQYSAHYATCNVDDIFNDKDIDLVLISTRHHLHGEYVLKALDAGKHVFVEKPLCTREEELKRIQNYYETHGAEELRHLPLLMVGFNRRFSTVCREAKKHTDKRLNPVMMHYRVNAGYIPLPHWVHGEEGGGRVVGEVCHFIDVFTFFAGCKIREIYSSVLAPKTKSLSSEDNRVVFLKYEDGSIATLDYFAIGSKAFPKEYLEIHFDEKTIVIDNFNTIKGYGVKVLQPPGGRGGKGHLQELEILYCALRDGRDKWPIQLWDMFQTTEATFALNNT
jgi:predicted dehydrogenase/threonine dehydrogenase-like Zn-dependent dehydrogenase